VAACVVIDANFAIDSPELELIRDSKKLSQKQREKIFPIIKQKAQAVAIGVCNHEIIDKVNILQATFLAMKKAVEDTNISIDYILVDGNMKIPKMDIPQEAIVDGDAKIFSIAAASIIAKVTRDYLMQEIDKKYPQYAFSKHKGYGTKLHLEKLKEFGPSPIHRRSFKPVKELLS